MSPTLKSTGWWITLGPNLGVFPLEQTGHVGVVKSEHPRLSNGEIIFEEFQPMWSQSTNVTDGQTDRQTTCHGNTALCTKVHRAVINCWSVYRICRCYGCAYVCFTVVFYRNVHARNLQQSCLTSWFTVLNNFIRNWVTVKSQDLMSDLSRKRH